MHTLLLIGSILLGLVMIPFGMPGTLVIFAAALCYRLLVPAGGVGTITVIGVGLLAVVAEGLDWVLAARFARRYGGSKRAGWGAFIGGVVGAFMGVPVPIIGSVIGAFAGAFVGALVFEWTGGMGHRDATRVAWGALLGRIVAAGVKVGVGLAMAVWLVAVAVAS